jgi:hypothetical protein
MDEAFLILDMADADNWGGNPRMGTLCRIPLDKRPTVVQDSREVAEREALRLQSFNPHGRFVVFEAIAVTVMLDTPTHVNLQGKTLYSRKVARLVEKSDGIPF